MPRTCSANPPPQARPSRATLSLGSFTTIAPAFVPQLIASFGARFPRVTLRLEEGTQDQLYAGLRSGRFDLGLLYDIDMPEDLAITALAAFDPYVLLPARHPLSRQKHVPLYALRDEPFILLDIAPSRTYFTRILAEAGITPKLAFASPSLEVVRGLVGQGLGYSILVTRPHGDRSYCRRSARRAPHLRNGGARRHRACSAAANAQDPPRLGLRGALHRLLQDHGAPDVSEASATIIGAGIVGMSTAAFLQRSGYKVTVIDRLAARRGLLLRQCRRHRLCRDRADHPSQACC